MKHRKFWMPTIILDKALDSCDLGDSCGARVVQYPHKDDIPNLTHVIEYSAFEASEAMNEKLKKDLDISEQRSKVRGDSLRDSSMENKKLRTDLKKCHNTLNYIRMTNSASLNEINNELYTESKEDLELSIKEVTRTLKKVFGDG